MGFYDERCMVSGLSLKSSEAVLVLLQKNDGDYSPVSLPVMGGYNRLGAIDGVEENENTKCILDFFVGKYDTDDLVMDDDEAPSDIEYAEDMTIEQLLAWIERGVTMEYDCVVYKGKRLEFALIDKTIWDKIVTAGFSSKTSFEEHSLWKEIYSGKITGYDDLLKQLNSAQGFLDAHNIKWCPPEDHSQHYTLEVTGYLEEAKTKFSSDKMMTDAIAEYESKLNEED